MKRTTLALAALATAGVLAAVMPSSAQQPGMGMRDMPMGRGMMGMMGDCPMMGTMMGGDMSTFAEGRVAFLKAELAITDAQKAVWEAYAAALKKNLQGIQAMRQTMMKVMEAKTPVERLRRTPCRHGRPPCIAEGGEAATSRALRCADRRAAEEGRPDPHRHGLHDVMSREGRATARLSRKIANTHRRQT